MTEETVGEGSILSQTEASKSQHQLHTTINQALYSTDRLPLCAVTIDKFTHTHHSLKFSSKHPEVKVIKKTYAISHSHKHACTLVYVHMYTHTKLGIT